MNVGDDTKVDIWTPGDPLEEGEDEPSLLCWVTDEIAVGPYCQAAYVDLMVREGIVKVVSIGELRPFYPREMKIQHVSYPLIDDCDDSYADDEIERVVKSILRGAEKGRTFVHCAAGVSRSPGFTAAAIARREGISWEEALAIVTAGRPQTKVHKLVAGRLKRWLEESSQP